MMMLLESLIMITCLFPLSHATCNPLNENMAVKAHEMMIQRPWTTLFVWLIVVLISGYTYV